MTYNNLIHFDDFIKTLLFLMYRKSVPPWSKAYQTPKQDTLTLNDDDRKETVSRCEQKETHGKSSLPMEGNKVSSCKVLLQFGCPGVMITFRTAYCACNWTGPPVPWLNTTAASASDTPSHWLRPELTRGCSSSGIWTLLKPLNNHKTTVRVVHYQ